MAKARGGGNRSAISGRYISKAAAARHPKTSVREAPGPNRGSGTNHRSAITGRFISGAAAARHPKTSLTEKN